MMNSLINPTQPCAFYRIIAVIFATKVYVIHGQIDFFRNSREAINRSPSSRCKWIEVETFSIKKFINKKGKCKFDYKMVEKFILVLSLFTIYQWENGLCSAATGEYGMCLPENDCVGKRGILGGPCAQGYGICCVCKRHNFTVTYHM